MIYYCAMDKDSFNYLKKRFITHTSETVEETVSKIVLKYGSDPTTMTTIFLSRRFSNKKCRGKTVTTYFYKDDKSLQDFKFPDVFVQYPVVKI